LVALEDVQRKLQASDGEGIGHRLNDLVIVTARGPTAIRRISGCNAKKCARCGAKNKKSNGEDQW
jgi:hypothetical protein